MRELKVIIHINRPVADVFAFAIDPQNTPQWVTDIAVEETNEWPVKIGSIYKSQNKKTGTWSEMTLTEFITNELFVLTNSRNQVRYMFKPLGSDTTELTYVWIDNGELEEAFLQELLNNFKNVMESL